MSMFPSGHTAPQSEFIIEYYNNDGSGQKHMAGTFACAGEGEAISKHA